MRPKREHATANRQTYFASSQTSERRQFFKAERWALLLVNTLQHYRKQGAYQLHEFVIMPDHFHALITPSGALERAMQYIKGGFSYRAKKELGYEFEIWQRGFSDHRIRDAEDYGRHVEYIRQNPLNQHLCESPQHYRYSSIASEDKDPAPQRLKPRFLSEQDGAPEGAPLQGQIK